MENNKIVLQEKYDLDNDILNKLFYLNDIFKIEKTINLSIDEAIMLLNDLMNYGDMQIWLIFHEIEGIEVSLNDKLNKFFELYSVEDILKLYDVNKNYNQSNIMDIRKSLVKR